MAQVVSAMLTAADAAMHSAACSLLKLNCRPLPGKDCAVEPVVSGIARCSQEKEGLTLPELIEAGQ